MKTQKGTETLTAAGAMTRQGGTREIPVTGDVDERAATTTESAQE